jgi:hypothetical protein
MGRLATGNVLCLNDCVKKVISDRSVKTLLMSGWSWRLGRTPGGIPEPKKKTKCELSEFWVSQPEGKFLI